MIDFESKRSGNAYYHTIDIHNLNFGQHTHRSYEMIFIKAGILKVTIENTEYIIKPNYAIIISPYQIHSFETIEYNDVFSCIYSPDMLQDFYDTTKNFDFESPVFSFMHKDLNTLSEQNKNIFEQKAVLYKYCASIIDSGLKKNFGMNFSAYINQIRLDEAVKLLKYTNKTSCEIANECGFSTIRIFNITFKNHFGITPREYRKKYNLE